MLAAASRMPQTVRAPREGKEENGSGHSTYGTKNV